MSAFSRQAFSPSCFSPNAFAFADAGFVPRPSAARTECVVMGDEMTRWVCVGADIHASVNVGEFLGYGVKFND